MVINSQLTEESAIVSILQGRKQVRLERSHSWSVLCLGLQPRDSFSSGYAIIARALDTLPSGLYMLALQPFASGHLPRPA